MVRLVMNYRIRGYNNYDIENYTLSLTMQSTTVGDLHLQQCEELSAIVRKASNV